MASTFSANTGFELPGDGEQTGLWGQTVNTNMEILDRALNGSADISISGTTHTLTTSDATLSDGQYAVVNFTGSPSGTNTITIAPNTAQKVYLVRNSTAQTIIMSQGSGATVSITTGRSKIIYTDGAGSGAAVYDLTDTLKLGTVAVADGGTGATDAATARTNLGLGTMATVASPAPVANGGTGATSAATARANLGAVGLTGNETVAGNKTFTGLTVFDADIEVGDVNVSTTGTNGFRIQQDPAATYQFLQCRAAELVTTPVLSHYRGTTLVYRIFADGDVTNLNNSYGAISDERLKTDITPCGPQLDDLRQIEVVKYRLKDVEDATLQVGVIAQQLQTVKPGLVTEDKDGMLSVKYSVFVPLLLKALQEIADRVDALEARVGGS